MSCNNRTDLSTSIDIPRHDGGSRWNPLRIISESIFLNAPFSGIESGESIANASTALIAFTMSLSS
ncbi:MAG: hypothetical protein ACP5GG_00140 [Conexivisphaera sp.]|jgi:hypothetical protein